MTVKDRISHGKRGFLEDKPGNISIRSRHFTESNRELIYSEVIHASFKFYTVIQNNSYCNYRLKI